MYLPGFEIGKQANETSIDYARRLINDLYTVNNFPWVVAYSGGKDSTLTLQLACEVSAEHNFQKPIIVQFNDTGVELNNKIERIKSVFNRLPAPIESRIIKPKFGLLTYIVGAGYPCPQPIFRYCTTELKIDPSDMFLKEISAIYGGAVVLQGVRKEESTKRRKYLIEEGAPERLKTKFQSYKIFYFRPIANVTTAELWQYLKKIENFYWDETIDELAQLYPDETTAQRDGCWICTVASEKSFNTKETTESQDRIRQYLRVINNDPCRRCLVRTPEQKRRLSEGIAAGRFTLEARKEFSIL